MNNVGIKISIRELALILAILVYSVFSSPFPRDIGVAEIAVAFLLICSVDLQKVLLLITGVSTFLGSKRGSNGFGVPRILLFSFPFIVMGPLIIGYYNGWHLVDVIRDVVPVAYIFLPFLIGPVLASSKNDWSKLLPNLICFIGVMYAVRFVFQEEVIVGEIGKKFFVDKNILSAREPSMMFAAVYLPIKSVEVLSQALQRKRFEYILLGFLLLLMGLACITVLIAVVQRGPLILIGLILFYYTIRSLTNFRLSGIIYFSFVVIMAFLFSEILFSSIDLIVRKHLEVGASGKLDEIQSVIKELNKSFGRFIFGIGWGGVYYNDVLQFYVTFTHSAFTFFLLKTGILGLVVFVYYQFWLIVGAIKYYESDHRDIIFASVPPLVVCLFLQASFKTFSCGLIFTIMYLIGNSGRLNAADGLLIWKRNRNREISYST